MGQGWAWLGQRDPRWFWVVALCLAGLFAQPLQCGWQANLLMWGTLRGASPSPTTAACVSSVPVVRATGVGLVHSNQAFAAVSLLEVAHRQRPSHQIVDVWLAQAHRQLGHDEAAEEVLARAHVVRPLRLQAEDALLGGRLDEAERVLWALYRHGYKDPWVCVRLANLVKDRGEWAVADHLQAEGLAADPENVWLWLSRGALREAQGQLDEAEVAYRQAMASDPHSGVPAMALGRLFLMQGQLDEAQRWLLQAQGLVQPPHDVTMTRLLSQLAQARQPTKQR